MDDFAEGWYNMILDRYLIMALGLYFKIYEQIISGVDVPYKVCKAAILQMLLNLIWTNACGEIKYFSRSKNRYVR